MGNLDALRDWGHAKDYVRMQWLMLQQDRPEDFVIATGVQYSVRQFIDMAAKELGVTLRFEGEGVNEQETLLGDPSTAKARLGWVPEVTMQEMCAEMIRTDLEYAKKFALLSRHGYRVQLSIENNQHS